MTTLLNLDAHLSRLNEIIDEIEDQIPAELAQAFEEILLERDETQEQYLTKLDNIAALIQNRKLWVEVRKAEAQRLAKLAQSDSKTVDWLTDYLKRHLEAKGYKKLRTKRFNLSVCANGGKPPLTLDNIDPKQLPQRFQKVTVEADKKAIREALEAGEFLSFAQFAEKGTHLRVR